MMVNLIGHGSVLERLRAEAASGRLSHAQLFVGPEHVGKTAIAIELAIVLQGGMLLAQMEKQIRDGLDADTLLFLDTGEGLGIEEVRRLVERVAQSHARPHLVVVIENIGRLKPEALNALLKTLEEPPSGTVFFLTAHREEDVLPTIRSRCHVTHFQTVAEGEMRRACEEHVQTERLLLFAMGRPGKLKHLMEDPVYLEAHERMLTEVLRFSQQPSTSGVFALVRQYEDDPLLPEFLDLFLAQMRAFALGKECPESLRGKDLTSVLSDLEDAKMALKSNVNARLVLENFFLTFVS